MAFRVEELALSSGLSVATIRYYQRLGLLDPPARRGRIGLYEQGHLLRLQEIRRLANRGLSLEQIGAVLSGKDPLSAILSERTEGGAMLTRDDLKARSGLPAELIDLAVEAGLLRASKVAVGLEDAERFPHAALEMLEAAAALLREGVDQAALINLALRHDDYTDAMVSEAIDLFKESIPPESGRSELASLLQRLLPHVQRLVSSHFHLNLLRQIGERAAGVERAAGAETPSSPSR